MACTMPLTFTAYGSRVISKVSAQPLGSKVAVRSRLGQHGAGLSAVYEIERAAVSQMVPMN